MYAPSVFGISGSSWLGFRVAGADGDAIVNGLKPTCNELQIYMSVSTPLRLAHEV